MSDLSGMLLDGRYKIGSVLARGGIATVYSAIDTRLDRLVAVKIMHQHLAKDEDFVERFIKEARAAASLTHPNIVAVHDQGWTQGGPPAVFLVMEFIDGLTLREIIRDSGPLDLQTTLQISAAVLRGLGAAHRAGIVHRDVKPENVIIAKDGRIKVADFGLAGALANGLITNASGPKSPTTGAYLSPEQIQRGIADARSDVYAVGIMLFEMLVGTQPFSAKTPARGAPQRGYAEVPRPSSLNPNIPLVIDALILHATAINPDDRPKNASEFLREVQSAHADLGPLVATNGKREQHHVMAKKTDRKPARPSAKKPAPKRKSGLRGVLFVVVALVIGGLGWYMMIGPGSGVTVPSIVGMSKNDASAALAKIGLSMTESSKTFSEQIPADQIISSKPAGGGHIGTGGIVRVEVSKGPERYEVPSLESRSITEATNLSVQRHLVLNTQNQVYSDTVPIGYIISTTPTAGTKVARDTVIYAIVSKGVAPITVVDYVGKSSDQALTELTTAGLSPVANMTYSDTVAAGIVISQTPTGGATVDKGAVVTLNVSKGPKTVRVPNVIGMTSAEAGLTLENAGLTFKVTILSKHGTGKVIGQIPAAGTQVKAGSLVNLDVY